MATKYNDEDYKELIRAYTAAKETGEKTLWERSDMAHEAAKKYGGLKQFAIDSGENLRTLGQFSYVAGRYEITTRVVNVPYRHYMVAASSDSRYEWLRKAEENKWSSEDMRRAMNADKPKKGKPVKNPPLQQPSPPTQPEPAKPRIHSWDVPEPSPLEAGFKPFIESWNMCYTLKALDGLSSDEIILLVFGMRETYKLLFDPEFGYRIIPLKEKEMSEPVKDGPSD